MTSWWKPRASNLLVIAAAFAAAALSFPSPAAAAGCPTTPVTEDGGSHWCYKHDASKGDVHLWKSPGYDASTAILVIYVHGIDNGNNGPDQCHSQRPYVDCIWDSSDAAIRKQFAASGVNGLFVAIEGGPVTYPIWGSLSSLVSSIQSKGNIAPPKSVTLIGHSAGMYTVNGFKSDPSVKHIIDLDWVKGREEPGIGEQMASWYKQGGDRKLTFVGGSTNQQAIMDTLSASLPCAKAANPSNLTQSEIEARCLYMKTSTNHMAVVFKQIYMPQAIKRSTSAAAGPAAPGSPSSPTGGGTGPVTRTLQDGAIDAPFLEIPIPGVSLTAAIRANGDLTIPWLAQYISGVYTFLLSIVGFVAAVMMVVGGFQYVTSGGDKGRVSAGKQKIVNALSGLVLAFGSYTVLYAINPNLVSFDGLKIVGVKTEIQDEINGSNESGLIAATTGSTSPTPGPGPDPGPPPPGGITKAPSAVCNTKASCKQYCDHCNPNCDSTIPTVTSGMASPKDVQVIPSDIPGVNGFGKSTSPTTIALLRKVGPMFAAEGFKLAIGSGYRDLHGQFKLACDAWDRGADGKVGSTIANPGGSFHGVGYAIDVQLYKNGQQITISGDSDGQQRENPDEAKYLAETMLKAGFRRLNNEIWHFEPANAPATGCRCYKIEDCTLPPHVQCR